MRSLRRLVVTLSVLILVSVTLYASPAQKRAMTIVDLINLPSIGSPEPSPDGSQVLYLRTDADWEENGTVTHIWRVNADGTGSVQLTNGERGESSPRWSPDGQRIAFLARRHGAEQTQVYLLNNSGGEGIALTEHPTSVSSISWSPDGRYIYFIAEDETAEEEKAREKVNDNVFAFDENWHYRHLWRVNADSGETERITEGEFTLAGYNVSRDGSLILHSRAPTPLYDDSLHSELWLMDADGGGARRLTDNEIPEGSAELSPDNNWVMFVANAGPNFDFYYNDNLFLMSANAHPGETPELLMADEPFEVGGATWSGDGESIIFSANTGVRQELFEVAVHDQQITQLTEGDHSIWSWTYLPELARIYFRMSTPTNPGELWMVGAAGGAPTRITHVYDYVEDEFLLPRVEAVQYPGEDGVMVEGLVYFPIDFEEGTRYPLVVQTHGGPAASDQFAFDSAFGYVNKLTAMGYMVFQPNYRGSTGYGDDFLRDMVGHYFNQAHKDVMAGVDYLIDRGWVDGDRMAKMGWSAGGHMTNKIITYTDRFKAASSGAGAINWMGMYAQSDVRIYRTPWFGGTPWEEDAPIDQYLADSPILEVYKVTTPTLVLVGENDQRVPMPQSVELYRALKSNGVPTHLYVAPRQGHGWRELQQRLFKANIELDWFERWVRGNDYEWEKSPVHPEEEEQ
jgi:dipeptidyl aminopeptidase/acylaminoacyl peptidase